MPDRVATVVLAAGEATRFGAPKQQLLLPHVLRRVAEAGIEDVVVVLGAYDFPVEGVTTVKAADWALGPGASLRAGLAALPGETAAAVVVLADGPHVAADAIRRVVDAWRAGAGDVVAASYGGVRGHPVCLGRAAWLHVPAAGGRDLDAVLVPCDDLGDPGDVDTPEDLRRIAPLLEDGAS
jgi:CTP:molybdopterin cytidylyltransferase MocA